MGRQVNFHMMDEDEQEFLDFVTGINDVRLVFSNYDQPGLHVINDYHTLYEIKPHTRKILFWDHKLEIDPRFFRSHKVREYVTAIVGYRETGKFSYSIDSWNAPVIEYSRSGVNEDKVLTRGRIWVNLYELRGESFFYKGKMLEDLFSKLARWLRKHLIRVEVQPHYFGKQALEWFRSGGQLSG